MIAALLLTALAFAQEPAPAGCLELARVSGAVNDCQLNPLFVRAADQCLAALNREVALRTAALAAATGAANQAAASSQVGKLANQSANLTSAAASLEAVKRAAEQARARVVQYRDNFMRPGRVRPALAARMSPAFLGILESFPCYRQNHAAISRYVQALDLKVAEADRALAGVGGLGARTATAERALGRDPAATAPAVRLESAGQSAPVQRLAAPRETESSITGIEEDQAKREPARPQP